MNRAGHITSAAKEVHHEEVAATIPITAWPSPAATNEAALKRDVMRTGQKLADEFRSTRPEILVGCHAK